MKASAIGNGLTKSSRWIDSQGTGDGIKLALEGQHAFINSRQSTLRRQGNCKLVDMGPTLSQGPLVMIWKKDFQYAELFNF